MQTLIYLFIQHKYLYTLPGGRQREWNQDSHCQHG